MVYGNNSAKVIADKLNFYKAKNIVTDPVMVSTSGSRLISEQGLENLKNTFCRFPHLSLRMYPRLKF